jgi:hypothetical protein
MLQWVYNYDDIMLQNDDVMLQKWVLHDDMLHDVNVAMGLHDNVTNG